MYRASIILQPNKIFGPPATCHLPLEDETRNWSYIVCSAQDINEVKAVMVYERTTLRVETDRQLGDLHMPMLRALACVNECILDCSYDAETSTTIIEYLNPPEMEIDENGRGVVQDGPPRHRAIEFVKYTEVGNMHLPIVRRLLGAGITGEWWYNSASCTTHIAYDTHKGQAGFPQLDSSGRPVQVIGAQDPGN